MDNNLYKEICSYLADTIRGSEWEGHLFVVGGAVRSLVMGDAIKDIDMVVDLPDGGIRFGRWIKEQGLTHHDLVEYPNFGVTMFRLDKFPDEKIEAVYTRCEWYLDRTTRNPETEFGSLEEDCFRRDLTINALYYNVSEGQLLDLTGMGLDDIKGHRIRVTSHPDIIFDDDPLRILRVVRFASRFGWEIDHDTYEGMKRNAHRLPMLSQERITDEVSKMLVSPNPAMAMEMLRQTGALQHVFPELMPMLDMTQNKYHDSTVWEHTMRVLGRIKTPELALRLAALLHDLGKVQTREIDNKGEAHFLKHELIGSRMAEALIKRMKWPKRLNRDVCFLVLNHMRLKHYKESLSDMRPKRINRLLYECGKPETLDRLLELIDADNNSHADGFCLSRQATNFREKSKGHEIMFGYRLPINGNDIIANCEVSRQSDVKLYLDHALILAFAEPDITAEKIMASLKRFKPKQTEARK